MDQRLNDTGDAEAISDFYLRNTDHLQPWQPEREPDFHSVDSWVLRLQNRIVEFESSTLTHFLTLDASTRKIVATCSLTNITRGLFQACKLGYAVCQTYEGKGLMKKLC